MSAPALDRPIGVLDLGVLADAWNGMDVATKSRTIAAKFPMLNGDQRIALMDRINKAHPPSRNVEYRERTVFVPAGDALAPTSGGTSMIAWAVLLLIAGGIFYATVNQKP